MFNVLKIQYNNVWVVLALFALLTANILAIFLILFKIPFFSIISSQPLFKLFLTYHVNLAMVFWMPLVACWLWAKLFNINKRIVFLSAILSIISLLLLVFSLSDIEHEITLSNYYPILHSYIFISSLLLQVFAVSMIVIAMLTKKVVLDKAMYLAKLAGFVWLSIPVALVGYLLTHELSFLSAQSIENFLWAPGHIQQTVNGLLIAAMWCLFLKLEKPSPLLRLLAWLSALSCVVALTFTLFYTDEGFSKQIFTLQMSLFSWLPMAIIAFELVKKRCQNIYIKLSLLVALLGVIAGTMIVRGTLSIPGHYHGMTGAFNLAFFAILLKNIPENLYQHRLTLSYGYGLVMLIVGLTIAGYLGIGRKLIAHQQGVLDLWQYTTMIVVAVGAFLAISASLLIAKSFFSLLKKGMKYS